MMNHRLRMHILVANVALHLLHRPVPLNVNRGTVPVTVIISIVIEAIIVIAIVTIALMAIAITANIHLTHWTHPLIMSDAIHDLIPVVIDNDIIAMNILHRLIENHVAMHLTVNRGLYRRNQLIVDPDQNIVANHQTLSVHVMFLLCLLLVQK